MAEDIRNRRITTEIENLEKIDREKIDFEKTYRAFDNSLVLHIRFNLKDHPYNPKFLTDQSELSLADPEVDCEGEQDHISDEEKEDLGPPVDELEDKEYEFDLIVPAKFPFMFPELRARCNFSVPSLMDEQDLLEDLLSKQWHPFIILKDIVERVPQYVYKVKQREKMGTLYYSSRSNFVLNSVYDLTLFDPEICKAFACCLPDGEEFLVKRKKKKDEELKRLENDHRQSQVEQPCLDNHCVEQVDDDIYKKYIIFISDNAFLLFERPPFEKKDDDNDSPYRVDESQLKFTMGKLILWGPITTIASLQRNMEYKDKITIVWSKPVKNDDEFEFNEEAENEELEEEVKDSEEPMERIFETMLQFQNSDGFMMTLLDKMNKIRENTDELRKNKILSMEVTSESLRSKNIRSILQKISIYEKELAEKPSKEISEELVEQYRRAIEYYSALGNDKYQQYVVKNHELMVKMQDM
ncbi:unnamed protein product [Moneuplotes crassus]|uniref:Uncharacterized protein n=1 Tax=Euplotes crassus TaxID=5936 RepID=A0AAD1UJ97_EUPCR|nr:unnamed protein product [Moneuplotes crassus]